jgi:hypothetical protein
MDAANVKQSGAVDPGSGAASGGDEAVGVVADPSPAATDTAD